MCRQVLFVSLLSILVLAGNANAQNNDIVKWGDGNQGTHFNIEDDLGTIVILRGDGLNYKFYAEDASQAQNFGIINNITVATGATGDFSLLIDHPTPGQRGASQWNTGDLRYPGGTCTVTGIDVVEALRRYDPPGPPPAIENLYCEAISGDISIDVLAPSSAGAPRLRVLHATSVVGNITVGDMTGDLDFQSFVGDVTVGESPGARMPGDITIRSDYAGTIQFLDGEGYGGYTHILGDFTGRFIVDPDRANSELCRVGNSSPSTQRHWICPACEQVNGR